jgi:hypothetical protein
MTPSWIGAGNMSVPRKYHRFSKKCHAHIFSLLLILQGISFGCDEAPRGDDAGDDDIGVAHSRSCLAKASAAIPSGFETVLSLIAEDAAHCTATAISARDVITAAHCLAAGRQKVTLWSGYLADSCALSTPSCAAVDAGVIHHPEVDLALIHLDEALRFAAGAVTFPKISRRYEFENFEFVGFGEGYHRLENVYCDVTAGELLLYGVFEVDWRDTMYFGAISDDREPNICRGDSGGPAVIRVSHAPELVGILSITYTYPDETPCTPDNGFQMWLRLSPFADWIEDARLAFSE